MDEIIILGGRVIDPLLGLCTRRDVVLSDGRIKSIGRQLPAGGRQVISAEGCWVMPGLIDMHVHLREPGQEHKEDLESGTAAAARGGFTAVACMANLEPPTDSGARIAHIRELAAKKGRVRVWPIAAVTVGLKGERLTDFKALKAAGAVALSDDGRPIMDRELMAAALAGAKEAGLPLSIHAEDLELAGEWAMNAGPRAERLGLRGLPVQAESEMVRRDLELNREIGAWLHVAHVSTADTVWAIAAARMAGVPVTAEAAPHHFTLTEEEVDGRDANTKMSPPLRSATDREEIRSALACGVIEAIASDHAPHSAAEKALPYSEAPNGIVGLETALPLTLELVAEGYLSIIDVVRTMSAIPARILGIPGGNLAPGNSADVVIVDPLASYQVDREAFASKGRNTPFHGRPVRGRVMYTLVGGKIVYSHESR